MHVIGTYYQQIYSQIIQSFLTIPTQIKPDNRTYPDNSTYPDIDPSTGFFIPLNYTQFFKAHKLNKEVNHIIVHSHGFTNQVKKMFHAFDENDLTFYNTNDIADIVCTFINTGTFYTIIYIFF
jgi:hypothetical protein